MSIKIKLLAALSVILVTAFVALSMINYTVTREAVREELLNSALPLTGKNIYSEIHAAMMKPILVSSTMANDTFLKQWAMRDEHEIDELKRYLAEYQSKYGFLSTFYISVATDKYYTPKGILKKISPRDPHDVWFFAFTGKRVEYELDVDTNQAADDALTIFVNYRVEEENGRLLGVTGVGLSMDNAAALLHGAHEKYGRNVYLVDQDGLTQVHADKQLIEKYDITTADGIKSIASQILQPRDKVVNFEYQRDGRNILLSTRYIPELKWHLIVEQDEDMALTTARHNMVRTLGIGLGASVLIIILCMLTINHFQRRLENMAQTDPLTGIANRRALEDHFKIAAYKADRYNSVFSIIIIDLDGFKDVNDKFGHLKGDAVLKDVAELISATVRPSDLLARWGGDEFIILLDGEEKDGLTLSSRIREPLADQKRDIPISFSCGVASYRKGDDIVSITRRADKAMYQAKRKGGSCSASG